MVPGSARNWIAVNAVQQFNFNKNETNETDNSALDKINRQVAVEACCLSRPAGARLLCVFAHRASQASDADANANSDFDTAPTPTPSPTTPTPSPSPTPPGEDRGNGNSAAENVDALNPATTGANNTAHGWSSLFSNTTGSNNTANGFDALLSNTTGNGNTANGFRCALKQHHRQP